jgi:hypothetical protein
MNYMCLQRKNKSDKHNTLNRIKAFAHPQMLFFYPGG